MQNVDPTITIRDMIAFCRSHPGSTIKIEVGDVGRPEPRMYVSLPRADHAWRMHFLAPNDLAEPTIAAALAERQAKELNEKRRELEAAGFTVSHRPLAVLGQGDGRTEIKA